MSDAERGPAPGGAGPSPQKPAPSGAERFERAALLVIVFVSGAVLMAFEITGARILEVPFGSTVFVWGGIIGIIMTALSIGYYAGGVLADRRPSLGLLSAVVACAGATMYVLAILLRHPVLDAIQARDWGARLQPLAGAIALFLVPSVLMGMVSPFAVRLSARDLARMGNVAGRLYALSTLGSIAGTLGTTFWLIPVLGLSALVYMMSALLVVMAMLGFAAAFAREAGAEARARREA